MKSPQERIEAAERELAEAKRLLNADTPKKWVVQYKRPNGMYHDSPWTKVYESRQEAVEAVVRKVYERFGNDDKLCDTWKVTEVSA